MKKLITLLCFLLAATVASAQPASPPHRFTLEQCLQYAFGNNYTRRSMKLIEMAKQRVYEQSRLERLPDLNASAGETFTNNRNSSRWGGNASLNANVTLYNGGNIGSKIAVARLDAARSREQTAQYDINQTIQILQAFLTIIGNEELLKYQQALLETSREQAEQSKLKQQAGTILPSDRLLLEAQEYTAFANITDTRAALQNNLLTLRNLMSMPPLDKLEIIYPDSLAPEELAPLPPLDNVLAAAMENLPERNISRQTIEIAREGIKQANATFLPTLSLRGSAGTAHTEWDDFGTQLNNGFNQSAGLTLSIPIFNKNRNRLTLMQSRMTKQKAELDSLQTDADLRQTVVRQYQNVESLREQYNAADISRDAYERNYAAYLAKYEAGSITPVDLLQQQNNYINALNRYIQCKYGLLLNRKILDVYTGEQLKIDSDSYRN